METDSPTDTLAPTDIPNQCTGCFCKGLCKRRVALTGRPNQKCMSRILGRKLRVVFRFMIKAVFNPARFNRKLQRALERYIGCIAEALEIRSTTVTTARSAHALENLHTVEVEMDVADGVEVGAVGDTEDDVREVMENAMGQIGHDEDLADQGITSYSNICETDRQRCADASVSTTEQNDSNDSKAGSSALISGIVVGALTLCGIGGAVAFLVKNRRSNAISFKQMNTVMREDDAEAKAAYNPVSKELSDKAEPSSSMLKDSI